MSATTVMKAVSDTYVRLFDHRPVINAEINYVLHEFETSRSDREGINCKKMLEQCHVTTEAMNEAQTTLERDYPVLIEKLMDSTEACRKIALREDLSVSSANAELLTRKERRSERWQQFLSEQNKQRLVIDARFDKEKKSIEQTYEELEQKLCSSP